MSNHKPRTVYTCTTCGHEHDNSPERCEQCGSKDLERREPKR